MYLVSKMTPMTATDRSSSHDEDMPITMAGIFMILRFRAAWRCYFTSSVVGIAQQWYLNARIRCPQLQRCAWEEVLRKNFIEADAARNVRTTNAQESPRWKLTAKRRPRPCDIF